MRELLLGDWRTKAWAFALALLLWYHASQQVLLTDTFDVPLQVTSPDNVQVTVERPADGIVEVRVQGRRTLVEALRGERLAVRVRMAPPAEPVATERVELTAKMVQGCPRDVTVIGLDPDVVKIILSRIGTKTLPVETPSPEELDTHRPGYEVAGIEVYPKTVEVEGPVSVLDKAEREERGLPIKPITLTPRETGWVQRRGWPLMDRLDGEQVHPQSTVTVYVLVVPKTERRVLEDVPVLIAHSADYPYEAQLDVGSKSVQIEVEGLPELVKALKRDAVEVVALVEGLEPDETQQHAKVRVILPDGITLVGDTPQVKVNIRERPLTPPTGQ